MDNRREEGREGSIHECNNKKVTKKIFLMLKKFKQCPSLFKKMTIIVQKVTFFVQQDDNHCSKSDFFCSIR